MARYSTKMSLLVHIRMNIPIKGCYSFIYCKAGRYESDSAKTMYLDADACLRFVMALMFAHVSGVNTDAESGNFMEYRSTSPRMSIP